MKNIGIVAEYNPFHNGHAHQLSRAKKLTNADFLVCAMSGAFVQRGEPAWLDKWTRAEAALRMAAAAGVEPKPEDAREFERLSALLYESDEVSAYLLARMSAQRLAAEVMERVAQAADIGAEIGDM